MTDECIHGFLIELCDTCRPRQRAESTTTAAPARLRRARAPRTSLRTPPEASAPRALRSASVLAEPPLGIVFSTLRGHHVTHVDNLASIVSDGAILASNSAAPSVDVSAPSTRQARSEANAPDGYPIGSHVTFALSPSADRWSELRSGATEQRWSDAARRSRAIDYLMLMVPIAAFGTDVIIADRDAELPDARFAVGPDASSALLRRVAINDPDFLSVEVLAGPRVPLRAVAVIGVPNDRVRKEVRRLLANMPDAPRVAVFPPWFVPRTPAE